MFPLLFVLVCSGLLHAAAAAVPPSSSLPSTSLLSFIDTRYGGGGFGFESAGVPPGPQFPFAALRLSPDTMEAKQLWLPFQHFGGYNYNDQVIRCFSHTHMVGAGVGDLGNFGVMPYRGALSSSVLSSGYYGSTFNKSSEVAQVGYYSAQLTDVDVLAELTAGGMWSGIHQYTYSASNQNAPSLLLDVCHTVANKGACKTAAITITPQWDSSVQIDAELLMGGSLSGRADGGGIMIYFSARIFFGFAMWNQTLSGVWSDGTYQPGVLKGQSSQQSLGALFIMEQIQQDVVVSMYAGISFINASMAQANLLNECYNEAFGAWIPFENAVARTQQAWHDVIDVVEVDVSSLQHSSASTAQLASFSSLLYHAFLSPTSYVESGGVYLGFDNVVHTWSYTHASGATSRYYSDMSLWDTHRTQNPLLGLLAPEVAIDIARSLLTIEEQAGDFPRWPLANVYTGCMSANHGLVSLSEWVRKGLLTNDVIDVQKLYDAMFAAVNSTRTHGGQDDFTDYVALGYVPSENDDHATSDTLEYAFDDGIVGGLATFLSQPEAALLLQRGANYKNVFSPADGIMCPRSKTGAFSCPTPLEQILPYPIDTHYTEADAYQNLFFVPHDPAGLIQLFPTEAAFIQKLDTFMNASFSWVFKHEELPNPFYWSGNEPSIFAAWLFAWTSKPWLASKWSRLVLSRRYALNDIENSEPGNDDYGTLSAWATWTALGLYPQAGTNNYILGAPLFPKVVIHRGAYGGDLTIIADNASLHNIYSLKTTLNGQAIDRFVTHQQLLQDEAVLEYITSDTPPSN